MKISLEWLREYLPGPVDPHVAGDALTNGGLPVEVFEKHGAGEAEDDVIDVEVTSNRGDCLSHAGVARELSALLNREFRDVNPVVAEASTAAESVVSVSIDAKELCPHYTARVIRGVKVGKSPAWMVRRLEAVGLRSVNNIVDVTNYVMFELGQPLHAFDFAKITGGRIVVRTARPGESLTSLDGHDRKLSPDMLVIADADRPVALAGVMGGLHSQVTPETVDILLESARFDTLSIRKTARSLAMKSDSSYRFERGIDPNLPLKAANRAAQLILLLAGGELLSGVVEDGGASGKAKPLTLRLSKLKQLLGVELPPASVVNAFERLNLSPKLQGDSIAVIVPSYRLDVNIEADLIEEAARVVGYDKIPVLDEISIRLTPAQPELKTLDAMRQVLVAGGYFEAVTVSFVSDTLATDFLPKEAAGLPRADASVRKADARLRPSLLPGLLEAVRRNETGGVADAKLFEIASTFHTDSSGTIVERRKLGLVGGEDLRRTRGVIESLLSTLDSGKSIEVRPEDHKGFASGASGTILWDGQPIGHLGLINGAVGKKLDLRSTPAGAELDVASLLEGAAQTRQLSPLPKFPAVRRDLSLVVEESMRFQQIERLVRAQSLPDLEGLEFVTTYRGKPLEKGTKSVTLALVFRSPTSTLTSDAVDLAVQKTVDAARSQLGATLRT